LSLAYQHAYSLKALNTFGFDAVAERFVAIDTLDQVRELHADIRRKPQPLLWLGGGSNLVLADQIPGTVAQIRLRGRRIETLNSDEVRVTLGAGENWHASVESLLDEDIFGLENLALIPGAVGSAPVQNIGAYGVEIGDRLEAVEVFDWSSAEHYWLSREDCAFGYRDSLFKRNPGRYLITRVRLRLNRRPAPVLTYAPLRQALADQSEPHPRAVFEAVCRIRRSKLPDPAQIGNAGSFFKNPLIDAAHHQQLRDRFPDLVAYPDGRHYKVAAGWLIDRLGWKGYRGGAVGVHRHQALVLVNYGGGNRQQIEALSGRIRRSVREAFAIELEVEPGFYPPTVQP
jgi:UDP-N-acetylmuramate dehydrogenase